MANAAEAPTCSNQDCRIATTGKCVEGLAVDQCPYYGKALPSQGSPSAKAVTKSAEEVEDADKSDEADIPLPAGEKLRADEADIVLKSRESRVIGIVAPSKAGKTTLIGSIIELLQLGPIGEFEFGRSQTFFAFERANHLARARSRGLAPDTEHTGLAEGLGFFHLAVGDRRTGNVVNLLLGDRSGEFYLNATDNIAKAAEFVEIRHADVTTLLLDGELLLQSSARQNLVANTKLILQALLEGGVFGGQRRLALVLTKYDLVQNSTGRGQADNDFERLGEQLYQMFAASMAEIKCFRISASPSPDSPLPRGFGLEPLLNFWLAAPVKIPHLSPTLVPPKRMFSRLRVMSRNL